MADILESWKGGGYRGVGQMLMKDDEGGMGGQANDDGPRQYLQGKHRPTAKCLASCNS